MAWTLDQIQGFLIRVGTIIQACAADQSGKNFVRNFWPIFGSRWPLFGLLGPLLAPLASGLTPSTCGNPVSTWPKQFFDQKYFREFCKKSKVAFLGPKLASYGLGTVIETSGSKFCLVLVPIMSQSDFVVRFYDQITIEKLRFLLVCSTTPVFWTFYPLSYHFYM